MHLQDSSERLLGLVLPWPTTPLQFGLRYSTGAWAKAYWRHLLFSFEWSASTRLSFVPSWCVLCRAYHDVQGVTVCQYASSGVLFSAPRYCLLYTELIGWVGAGCIRWRSTDLIARACFYRVVSWATSGRTVKVRHSWSSFDWQRYPFLSV